MELGEARLARHIGEARFGSARGQHPVDFAQVVRTLVRGIRCAAWSNRLRRAAVQSMGDIGEILTRFVGLRLMIAIKLHADGSPKQTDNRQPGRAP